MDNPKISVIIVSWNTEKYLKACLESLTLNIKALGYEVFVIDNNSTDGSADMVASVFPAVKLVRNPVNVGFAKANNIGISLTSGEYVLILNPDTSILPGAIEKMAVFMDEHAGAGACGPAILDEEGRVSPWMLRFATLKEAFGRDTALGKILPGVFRVDRTAAAPDKPEKVDWLHGCCMLVRKKTIQAVGAMEEKLFLTFEEQDWCLRMHKKKWDTYYFPGAGIIHYGGKSREQTDQLEDYLHMRRSEYVFYGKRYGVLPVLFLRGLVALSSLLGLLKWRAISVVKGEAPEVSKKTIFYRALLKVSSGLV